LRREIKEETNLEVAKIKYLLDIAFIRADGIPVIILSFYCPYQSGKVRLDDDNIAHAWATYEEAKRHDLVKGLLEEIAMVDKILKGVSQDNVQYGR